jgi:hypothetical protein
LPNNDGSDIAAVVGPQTPAAGAPPLDTTLAGAFGMELRAVCFVGDFLFEEGFIENTPAELDPENILRQIRNDHTDSDHVWVYLVDVSGNVTSRFRAHQLAPELQVYPAGRTGLMGCRGPGHPVELSRQTGGRILLMVETLNEESH